MESKDTCNRSISELEKLCKSITISVYEIKKYPETMKYIGEYIIQINSDYTKGGKTHENQPKN